MDLYPVSRTGACGSQITIPLMVVWALQNIVSINLLTVAPR